MKTVKEKRHHKKYIFLSTVLWWLLNMIDLTLWSEVNFCFIPPPISDLIVFFNRVTREIRVTKVLSDSTTKMTSEVKRGVGVQTQVMTIGY